MVVGGAESRHAATGGVRLGAVLSCSSSGASARLQLRMQPRSVLC